MSLLVAGALALSFQSTPADLGYDVFSLGGCDQAGWAHDEEAAYAHAQTALEASGLTQTQFEAELNAGFERAMAEFRTRQNAITNRAEAIAFIQTLEARCEALTGAYPEILTRTSETDAAWSDYSRRVAGAAPD